MGGCVSIDWAGRDENEEQIYVFSPSFGSGLSRAGVQVSFWDFGLVKITYLFTKTSTVPLQKGFLLVMVMLFGYMGFENRDIMTKAAALLKID